MKYLIVNFDWEDDAAEGVGVENEAQVLLVEAETAKQARQDFEQCEEKELGFWYAIFDGKLVPREIDGWEVAYVRGGKRERALKTFILVDFEWDRSGEEQKSEGWSPSPERAEIITVKAETAARAREAFEAGEDRAMNCWYEIFEGRIVPDRIAGLEVAYARGGKLGSSQGGTK